MIRRLLFIIHCLLFGVEGSERNRKEQACAVDFCMLLAGRAADREEDHAEHTPNHYHIHNDYMYCLSNLNPNPFSPKPQP